MHCHANVSPSAFMYNNGLKLRVIHCNNGPKLHPEMTTLGLHTHYRLRLDFT